MGVDKVHELVDLFPDPNFFVGFDCQSFFDLIDISALDFAQGGINMCKNLFPEFLKIVVKFIDCIVGFFLFCFEHQNAFLLEFTFPFIQFLLALSP